MWPTRHVRGRREAQGSDQLVPEPGVPNKGARGLETQDRKEWPQWPMTSSSQCRSPQERRGGPTQDAEEEDGPRCWVSSHRGHRFLPPPAAGFLEPHLG